MLNWIQGRAGACFYEHMLFLDISFLGFIIVCKKFVCDAIFLFKSQILPSIGTMSLPLSNQHF